MVVAIGTSINAADKFPVAFHEIQAVEFALGMPAQVVKDQVLRLAGELENPEEDELSVCLLSPTTTAPRSRATPATSSRPPGTWGRTGSRSPTCWVGLT